MKNIGVFLSENFQFLEVKSSIFLSRHVFIMSKVWEEMLSFWKRPLFRREGKLL